MIENSFFFSFSKRPVGWRIDVCFLASDNESVHWCERMWLGASFWIEIGLVWAIEVWEKQFTMNEI